MSAARWVSKKNKWLRAGVCAGCVLAFAGAAVAQTQDGRSTQTTSPKVSPKIGVQKAAQIAGAQVGRVVVPDLTNKTCAEARQYLISLETSLQVQCNGESQAAPRVSRQNPAPKAVVARGSVVQAYFDPPPQTSGPTVTSVIVPDVRQMTCADAQQYMISHELALRVRCYQDSNSQPYIARQNPGPNTTVKRWTTVLAYFDLKPAPPINTGEDYGKPVSKQIQVPDLNNLTCASARSLLVTHHLRLRVQCNGEGQWSPYISRQAPFAGTFVNPGTQIQAYFDMLPVQVPSLHGLTEDEARGVLAEHNLALGSVSTLKQADGTPGRVGPQKPNEGASVAAGTVVSIGINPDRLTIRPARANLKAGQQLVVEAILEPNRPGAIYEFFWNDPHDASGSTRTVAARAAHVYKAPGNYSVYAVATDPATGAGMRSNSEAVEIMALPPPTPKIAEKKPQPLTVALTTDPKDPGAGKPVTLRAVLSRAEPGAQFTYWFGDGQGVPATSDSISHVYASGGRTYVASVSVMVNGKEVAKASRDVRVPTPIPTPWWYGVGLAVAGAAAVVVRVHFRNKKINKVRQQLSIVPVPAPPEIEQQSRAMLTPAAVRISVEIPAGEYEMVSGAKAGGR